MFINTKKELKKALRKAYEKGYEKGIEEGRKELREELKYLDEDTGWDFDDDDGIGCTDTEDIDYGWFAKKKDDSFKPKTIESVGFPKHLKWWGD